MSKRPPPIHPRPNVLNPTLEQAMVWLRALRPHEAERLASVVLKADRGNVVAAQVLAEALLLLHAHSSDRGHAFHAMVGAYST
jgi:flavin reductase (DIM6/NTAB) family NADH-FMN oxidoreductase RutF